MSITDLMTRFDFQARRSRVDYLKDFFYAVAGLFVIDIAWRIMDNFIDHWLIPHAQYLNWLIGSN